MKQPINQIAYDKGWEAYNLGHERTRNPYRLKGTCHRSWDKGWRDCQTFDHSAIDLRQLELAYEDTEQNERTDS